MLASSTGQQMKPNPRSEIPLIHDRVEDGQQYFAQSGPARVNGIYRQGAIMPRTFTHTDGSLMAQADG
jgi:hypothetical protein